MAVPRCLDLTTDVSSSETTETSATKELHPHLTPTPLHPLHRMGYDVYFVSEKNKNCWYIYKIASRKSVMEWKYSVKIRVVVKTPETIYKCFN